jgi:hypothetical protein
MAVSAPTLGGQSLQTPTKYRQYAGYRGGTSIMADGSMTTDLVSTSEKLRWELGWDWLTAAQVTTLRTAVGVVKNASGTYVDLDGTSYTVTLDENFLELEVEMKKVAGNNQRFATSIKLRQV